MILKNSQKFVTFVLPTFNEVENISFVIDRLIEYSDNFEIEILVVDDGSTDGTDSLVRELSKKERRIRIINRHNRYGLSSAIKEGCLCATGDIIAIMDTDGQHEANNIYEAINLLINKNSDLIIGSRFLDNSSIQGLSKKRKMGSSLANNIAKLSLSKRYHHITDLMSGCIVFNRNKVIKFIKKIDVNGFKFLFELLSVSNGNLTSQEIPLNFLPRKFGESKLDISVVWDFGISLIHSFCKRLIPRKAISFAFVSMTGFIVQLFISYSLIWFLGISFANALPYAVICAATSNYLINNWLTFRRNRLRNKALIVGLIKFLVVASLPIIANVGLASSFYKFVSPNTFLSQCAGIIVVFIWNYAASSRLVWRS